MIGGLPGTVLAFGFFQPWLLAWLAAAAIPVLIHLWSRHRSRQIAWAAMEFLLAALKARRRRLLLEEWLLLCLRVLTLILLALAVAQPFVGRAASPASAVARVHRLVLLDASFSMKAEHNGSTSFDRAKEELGKLLRQAQPNDLLTLGTFTARVNWVFREPVTAAADIARQLEQLRPSDAACDLPHVLAEIAAALREARNRNRQVQAYEVWIFTDLQASNWSPPDPARAEQIARRLHQLEQEASIRIVDVSSPQTANIAVVDVSFFPDPVVAGDNVEIVARIGSFGALVPRTVQVVILVDGHTAGKQTMTVPGQGEGLARGSYRFFSPGDHLVEISLVDHADALAADDRLEAVVSVRPALRVLCVDGMPGPPPLGGASGYLVMALNPGVGPQDRSPAFVDRRPVSALVDTELAPFDVVFLCSVAELAPPEADRLARFVRAGGGLVIFLGENARPASWNLLAESPEEALPPLLPARLVRPIVDSPQLRLDPLGYTHPLLAVFRDFDRAGLVNVPVEKYWQLEVIAGYGAQTALALGNGMPLVVEKNLGRGRVLLAAIPADPSWSMLPKWPSFVPLVHEMLRFAAGGKFPRKNLRWHECLEGFLPEAKAGQEFVLKLPSGEEEPLPLSLEPGGLSWRYCPRELSGIYRLQSREGEEALYAVFRPQEESDLRPGKIPAQSTQPDEGEGIVVLRHGQLTPSAPQASRHGVHDLTGELLYALAFLMVLEAVLACHIGRRGL